MSTYSCNQSLANTGSPGCSENLNGIKGFVWTPRGFAFDAESKFQTLADWIAAIEQVDGRIYVFPEFLEVEAQDEETQYQTFNSGKRLKVREGKPGFRGTMDIPTCVLKNLRTFNQQKGRIFPFYESGVILGTSPDGEAIKGLDINLLEVEKLPMTDNNTRSLAKVMVILNDATEMNDNVVSYKPTTWSFDDLFGLQNVALTTSSPTTSAVTVSAVEECTGDAVLGLTETTDWIILDDESSAVSVTEVTDNGSGSYTLAATLTAGDYTVTLAAPTTLGVDGYESAGAVSFTTSA